MILDDDLVDEIEDALKTALAELPKIRFDARGSFMVDEPYFVAVRRLPV